MLGTLIFIKNCIFGGGKSGDLVILYSEKKIKPMQMLNFRI